MKHRDVTLCSPSAYHFIEYLYKVLDCDFSPYNLPIRTNVGILFGLFVSQKDFLTPLQDCSRKIGIWIGTDVIQLQGFMKRRPEVIPFLNDYLDVKLADADNLAAELEIMGIKMSGVVETPPRIILKSMPLPKTPTVGIYAPPGRAEFYYTDLCLEVAKAMPDVQFRLYHQNRKFGILSENVFDLGRIEVAREMPGFSAILRLTQHDGVAIGPVEFMQAGRYAVTNQDIPMAERIEPTVEAAVAALRKVLANKEPNKAASKYWRERLNHDKWRELMEGYIA